MSKQSKNILLGVTGSIAAYKAAELTSLWKKAGHTVRVILTPSAREFIGAATFSGLTGENVWTDVFESGRTMDHIHLTRWADVFVIAPATANIIGKMSSGIADDMITTTFLATPKDKPIYLAPAMNAEMWANAIIQQNIQKLESHGVQIIHPNSGELACGEIGPGRMAEPEQIDRILFHHEPKGRILITFGGTKEAIDGVRSITNTSTGQTGADLADYFYRNGFEVVCLAASNANKPRMPLRSESFESYQDLNDKLKTLLNTEPFDHVIHCAAVSDFSVEHIQAGEKMIVPDKGIKIGSEKSMTIQLRRNPKIIANIRAWSQKPLKSLIAFKLTNTKDLSERNTAIDELMKVNGVSAVVHNDIHTIGTDRTKHIFSIYQKGVSEMQCQGVIELGTRLEQLFTQDRPVKKSPLFQLEAHNDFMS